MEKSKIKVYELKKNAETLNTYEDEDEEFNDSLINADGNLYTYNNYYR
jgi:hypothetical protein